MIKSFCNECKHKDVSEELKKLFNENVQETFVICPCNDLDQIAGCFNSKLTVDWDGFEEFCKENKLLK